MFPIHNNNLLGAVTSSASSSSAKPEAGVSPFADISAGSGIGDSTAFSSQALFGAAASSGLPQSSLDFIDSLNDDTDHQGLVEDGLFSQSTLNVLKALAQ